MIFWKTLTILQWLFPQLIIEVYDSAFPYNRGTGEITVTVIRNANAPEFTEDIYSKTVDDNYPIGEDLLQVEAEDEDKVKITTCDNLCSNMISRIR